ncbi:MAG: hypothetical protein KAU20_00930 [Nanoarchaeota archaeon]|nr:hypothetical protein [Nanoarchaeota archaeon]
MAAKKKPKSVEDIINDMQSVRDKPFKDRITKFEEFHKPEAQHGLRFQQHAEYAIWGKPSDRKNYPGAYEHAYQKLDSLVKEDDAKLEKEEDILSILELYVDKFLEKAMGNKFKEALEHAKEESLSDDDIRDMKNTFIANYLRDERGNPIIYLNKDEAKKHKGKTKMEMIEHLRGMGEEIVKSYHSYLTKKATEGLIKHYDIPDLAKHVKPKFEDAGFKPDDHYLTKSHARLEAEYSALLKGAGETLQKFGYKKITKEKKDNKK